MSLEDELEAARREISLLAEERDRAKRVMREAQEELQQFSYAASHDLQEPLRSIATYTQLLQRESATSGQSKEYLQYILEGVNRMNLLIQDLLAYSRTGPPARRTMLKLNSVFEWSRMNLAKEIQESGAQITCGDLPEAAVDESQFAQLFQHLLGNALKFRSNEPPKIDITATEENGEYVISIQDNGVGIEPRFYTQVFGVFKRLHGRQVPGTGMGLALCKKIVEGHSGRIWVESDGHHGSVFKFTIPA